MNCVNIIEKWATPLSAEKRRTGRFLWNSESLFLSMDLFHILFILILLVLMCADWKTCIISVILQLIVQYSVIKIIVTEVFAEMQ